MSPTATRQNELLDALAADEAVTARLFAHRIGRLAELADLADQDGRMTGVEQFVAMELAGTTRKGKVASGNELRDAERYVEALPLTLAALERGALYTHQARTILTSTDNCTVEVARRVESRVLPGATELAPPDLRRRLRRAILQVESELNSEAAAERLAAARATRRVWARGEDDGMASIGVLAPAEQVQQFLLDLDRLVLQEKAADRATGVWRSADQIRSDLVLSTPRLLLEHRERDGAAAPTHPAKDSIVNVFVPVTTVLDRGHEPGELGGYGPISAEHVRLMRPDARFRRVFVDSQTGQPIHLDEDLQPVAQDAATAMDRILAMLRPAVVTQTAEPQHDPSRELRRLVEVRDLRCRGVGCSLPAARCHQDHTVPYPLGPTAAGNLDPLSSSCHRAKHSGWIILIGPDGSTTWISPLGRRYTRPPAHTPPLLPTERPSLRRPRQPHPERSTDDDSDEPLLLPPDPPAAADVPSHIIAFDDDEPPF
ncbi:MAG: hypothetical protein JWP11_683 [Frankiales bacterium]|nr:hypothetical protein [Frankiales bacterium]